MKFRQGLGAEAVTYKFGNVCIDSMSVKLRDVRLSPRIEGRQRIGPSKTI